MISQELEEIKKLVLIALVSDDDLMETLVLKGGNAMLLGHDIGTRASFDLDFSMEADFIEDTEEIFQRIKASLVEVFLEQNYMSA